MRAGSSSTGATSASCRPPAARGSGWRDRSRSRASSTASPPRETLRSPFRPPSATASDSGSRRNGLRACASRRKLIADVGLSPLGNLIASKMSHGQHRQLELGMALATHPIMLLLDEPMAGLGIEESRAMSKLLASLKRQYTILLIEHDMDAVFSLADRISVLVGGRIVASGTADEIRSHPGVRVAYLGEDDDAGDFRADGRRARDELRPEPGAVRRRSP